MAHTPLAMRNTPAAMAVRCDRMAVARLRADDLDGYRRLCARSIRFMSLPGFDEAEHQALLIQFAPEA